MAVVVMDRSVLASRAPVNISWQGQREAHLGEGGRGAAAASQTPRQGAGEWAANGDGSRRASGSADVLPSRSRSLTCGSW